MEVFRRLAAGASSSISVALPFDLPVESDAGVVDVVGAPVLAGAGFAFFLTITPFRFRFASFLAAGATMGLGGGVGLEAEADAGGWLIAVARAATALQYAELGSPGGMTMGRLLLEIADLFSILLLPFAFLCFLTFPYRVKEQDLVFLQGSVLVSFCMPSAEVQGWMHAWFSYQAWSFPPILLVSQSIGNQPLGYTLACESAVTYLIRSKFLLCRRIIMSGSIDWS